MTQPAELKVNLHQLLKTMIEKGASDMHITTGLPAPPADRREHRAPQAAAARPGRDQAAVLLGPQRGAARAVREAQRARSVVRRQGPRRAFARTSTCSAARWPAAFRTIPFKILTFEELGLPPIVADFADKPSGLVLVTGPTGSGKSTTLAADHRQDQHRAAPAHHHRRRPDRVPAPAQALDHQPARGGQRHRGVQERAQVRPAAGPGRGPRR